MYLYNPRTLRRYHIDTDTWEDSIPVRLVHRDGATELFVDPSPILDDNEKIVLFYIVGQIGGDSARCLSSQTSCVKLFRSATEVQDSDGAAFVIDEGNRAEIAITSTSTASDPDIFKGPAGFVLYISRGPSVQVLSSDNLRGSYANVPGLPDGIMARGSGGIPSGHYEVSTSQYWTYVHAPQGNTPVIRRAVHRSVISPISDAQFSTIITGCDFTGLGCSYRVESPGFAVNTS